VKRIGALSRKTTETDITIKINLDGRGRGKISTGIGFLDHMLAHVAKHGSLDVDIAAKGDLHVDYHHTVEDIGLTLGEVLKKALGDKKGINRYGSATIPMDESLALVVIDLSGRPVVKYDCPLPDSACAGEFALNLVPVFLHGLAQRAGITLHARVVTAEDPHHAAEALFKALGRALRQAVALDPRVKDVPSTKGILE
jgi:imidazoleglycerol-phosphate dehydratase